MKKFISLLLLVFFCSAASYAQFLLNPQEAVKNDSTLVIGKLDNGLTYYIRKNANPEHRAEFYIATDVGAIQETPAQRGLAHFLEHMCFNGNRDFPGNTMMSYLEKNGLIFGANINAMTGVESTIYTLNAIPTDRKAMVDTALVILLNDAAFVTNDPAEVEKERGVIIEEWRSGNSAQRRQQEQMFKVIFKGTKYADCNIIGDEECLKSFDPQELVNFYKTWYYPANQAIIVAGDVDVKYVEGKIKELFGALPKKEIEPAKEKIVVPGNEAPDYMIFTDPELVAKNLMILIKQEKMPKEYNSLGLGVLNGMMKDLIASMLNERLDDASKAPGAKFSSASGSVTSLNNSLEAFFVGCMVNDKASEALEGIMAVLRQIQTYGFTQGEFDRAKASLLRRYQAIADAAATRTNRTYAMACVNNFIDNEPVADPVYMNEVVKQYASLVNVDALNQAIKQIIRPTDNIIIYSGPQKEGEVAPTEAELSAAYKSAFEKEIKPLEDEGAMEPLIAEGQVKAGSIVKSEKGYLGTEVLTLSNGVKVYLYPNDLRKDAVTFSLYQEGGKSILPQELLPSFEDNVMAFIGQNAGVSKFSQSKLNKMLAGKQVSVSAYLGDITSRLSGRSSSKDVETMLQLAYLKFTQPRCEPDEFKNSYDQLVAIAANIESSPEFKYQVMLSDVMNNSSKRALTINSEMLKEVSPEKVRQGNEILFGNAEGAKVFIGGDFKTDEIKPLIEKYIASLPVKKDGKHKIVDHNLYPAKGVTDNVKTMKMQNPNVYAAILYTGDSEYNKENNLRLSAMSYVLEMRYIASLREEDGGTYSPSVGGTIYPQPKPLYIFQVMFQTQLEKAQGLIDKVYAGLNDLASNGPTSEEMTKTVEMLKKQIPENKKNPGYWMNLITDYYRQGVDMQSTTEDIDKFVTAESIQNMAKQLVNDNNRALVELVPEK